MSLPSSLFRSLGGPHLALQHFAYPTTHHFPQRRLPEYAIVCCFSGRIEVTENLAQTSLLPGEILIGNPALPRASRYIPTQSSCSGATIVSSIEYMTQLLEETRLNLSGPALFFGKIYAPRLVGSLESLFTNSTLQPHGLQSWLNGFLAQFLIEVLWQWPPAAIAPRQIAPTHLLSRRHFVHAAEYMNHCGKEQFSVEGLCDHVGMSLAHFRRLMLASASRTPLDFYNTILIERAKSLLHSTSSIKDVSYQLGFSTPSQFARIFRSYAGCSPSEFQDRKLLNDPPLLLAQS